MGQTMNRPAVWVQCEGEQVIAPKSGSPVWRHTDIVTRMVIPNYIEDGIIYKLQMFFNITAIITLTASAEGDFSRMWEK